MKKLSVIIVNYNVQYFLEQCLLSVQSASKNMEVEVIVVDNNSSDDSCAMIDRKFPEVVLIANKENIGFSKANNQGVSIAKGEFVLILNPDTVVAEDTFDEVVAFAEEKPNVGAVGIKFIDGTGCFLPECKRNVPTLKISLQKIIGKSKSYYATHLAENAIGKVEVLTGAFMLMKREVYLDVKGFDEDYFMFGEDIDLSYKISKQGLQNYYFGKVKMLHYKGESTNKDLKYLKNFYGAMYIFSKKHFKTNLVLDFFLLLGMKFLIAIKTLKKTNPIEKERLVNTVLLCSKNLNLLLKIKKTYPNTEVSDTIAVENSKVDMVIFDNNYLSNKEIVTQFDKGVEKKIYKRIIPKNTNFYLGSDTSISRGEVVKF